MHYFNIHKLRTISLFPFCFPVVPPCTPLCMLFVPVRYVSLWCGFFEVQIEFRQGLIDESL